MEKTLEGALDSNEIKPVNPKKKINPKYSFEGLMLNRQHFDHMTQRADSLEKTLMLGKIEKEEKGPTEDEMVGWPH